MLHSPLQRSYLKIKQWIHMSPKTYKTLTLVYVETSKNLSFSSFTFYKDQSFDNNKII